MSLVNILTFDDLLTFTINYNKKVSLNKRNIFSLIDLYPTIIAKANSLFDSKQYIETKEKIVDNINKSKKFCSILRNPTFKALNQLQAIRSFQVKILKSNEIKTNYITEYNPELIKNVKTFNKINIQLINRHSMETAYNIDEYICYRKNNYIYNKQIINSIEKPDFNQFINNDKCITLIAADQYNIFGNIFKGNYTQEESSILTTHWHGLYDAMKPYYLNKDGIGLCKTIIAENVEIAYNYNGFEEVPIKKTSLMFNSAPNLKLLTKEEKSKYHYTIIDLINYNCFMILYSAKITGYNNINLCAIGCGAFQNSPTVVFNAFKMLLNTICKNWFENVFFSLIGNPETQQNEAQCVSFCALRPSMTAKTDRIIKSFNKAFKNKIKYKGFNPVMTEDMKNLIKILNERHK